MLEALLEPMPNADAMFVVYNDRMGEWRFRFMCTIGINRLRASEGYNAKASALKAIESVKRNLQEQRRFDYKLNSRGKHFFTLRARNGNILAVSRNHLELDDLEGDINVLKHQAPRAEVVEGPGV